MTFPRYFIWSLIIMMMIPLLTACSVGTTIAHGANFAVSRYCDIPKIGRSAVRKTVDTTVAPSSIQIICAND
mgnify:FL=1